MLRRLALLLILVNLLFFFWTRGWFDNIVDGWRAQPEREPERLKRQVRPETIVVLPPDSAPPTGSGPASTAAAENGTPVCLEAGPFATGASISAIATLQSSLPAGSWTDVQTDSGGEWIVYLGRFTSRDALAKRIDELKRAHIDYEEVHGRSELEPGLSLGRFTDRAAAERSADQFTDRGVRGAKIIEMEAPVAQHMLRVETRDKALAARALALRSTALGRGFAPCAPKN